jgi:hypothetical protein
VLFEAILQSMVPPEKQTKMVFTGQTTTPSAYAGRGCKIRCSDGKCYLAPLGSVGTHVPMEDRGFLSYCASASPKCPGVLKPNIVDRLDQPRA